MKTYKIFFLFIFFATFISFETHAISFGEDDDFRHPNIVSLRFIENDFDAFLSCSGALIHKDADKYVFLTAGHCAQTELEGWNSVPAGSGSVGVSFDENNLPNDTDPSDGGADGVVYVRGGVAIPHPQYRFPGETGNNDHFDTALVIIPIDGTNSFGETIQDRWGGIPGALTPATLAPLGFFDTLFPTIPNPKKTLIFTAVGFGTQSEKTPQGSGKGNKIKIDPDASFPDRKLTHSGYKNHDRFMIDVVVNTTQGDFGYLCPGDSGGPQIYEDQNGNETIIGVLTAGNCRAYGAYSRIDIKPVIDFISCAFVSGDATDVQSCVDSTFE